MTIINSADLARVILNEALASNPRERLALTVSARQIDLVVFDPLRDRRIGSSRVEDTGYRTNDHKITIEIVHGMLRLTYIHPEPGDGPQLRDQRIAVDDADEATVTAMVRAALEAARDPF